MERKTTGKAHTIIGRQIVTLGIPRKIAGSMIAVAAAVVAGSAAWQVTGAGTAVAQAPAAPAITIDAFQFKPKELEVKAETKVVWTNDDDVLHTVTSGTPERRTDLFNSNLNGKGAKFEFTFGRPGTYSYFCNRHQQMRGEITVK